LEKCNTEAWRVQGGRILVIRAGALGDTILALPALRALRARNSRLELVGYPSVLRVARLAMRVDAIHSIDRALFSGLFSGALSAELERFLASFDLVIAWTRDSTAGLLHKLRAVGIGCLHADPYPAAGSGVHASLHLLRTLAALGVGDRALPLRLSLPAEACRASEELLREAGLARGRFLAIHPGSGNARKNWEPKKFAALAELARRAGWPVLIVEGEADGDAVRELRASIPWQPETVERPSLPVLAALLSQAGVFVGNDSGVSHLAASSGVPTLALFGPTDPSIWRPLGPQVGIQPLAASVEAVWGQACRLAAAWGAHPTRRAPRGETPTE
jgi:ADP-heptose:LPS heptosyltransferase